MIIAVDFLEHWKTKLLRRLTGKRHAAEYLIALWAHCQIRNTDVIPSADALFAICGWEDEKSGEKLVSALLECGWVEKRQKKYIVHGWKDANAGLLSARENGKKGGRPKSAKKPKRNPSVNGGLTGIEIGLTHAEPIEGNRIGLDEIEEEKRRGEGEENRASLFVLRFTQFWKSEYPQFHAGQKYIGDEKLDTLKLDDFAASSELVAMSPAEVDSIFETARAAWKNPNGFRSGQAAMARGFLSNYNAIIDELTHGNDQTKKISGRKSAEQLEEERMEKESAQRQQAAGRK